MNDLLFLYSSVTTVLQTIIFETRMYSHGTSFKMIPLKKKEDSNDVVVQNDRVHLSLSDEFDTQVYIYNSQTGPLSAG